MRYLVFQHLDIEHPGIFREFWRDAGIEWTTIALNEGDPIPTDLMQYDALAVMGGPMDTWQTDVHPWLVREIDAIRRYVVTLRKPYIGICLGHQLLACALGGAVGAAAQPEVGIYPINPTDAGRTDPFLRNIAFPLDVLQWHGAEVTSLPADAQVLAASPLCAIQAFRWGPHAFGVQFHAEISATTVTEWASVPEYAASLRQTLGADGAKTLMRQVVEALPAFRNTALQLHRNLLACFNAEVPA